MSGWTIPHRGEVEVLIDASSEQAYAVLSDVTRVAEWSHECRNAEWIEGAIGPQLGARFRGRSWAARFAWTRVCTITELVPGRRFAYLTGGGLGDSTRWTFDLAAEGSRTRVRQSFEAVTFPRALELFVFAFIPAHRDRRDALRADLVRLGEVAAGRRPPSVATA